MRGIALRFIRLIGLMLLLGVLLPVPAYAMDEPDSVTLSDITIYEDLITTGDMTVLAPYSIPFTALPDDGLDKTFIFRMLSADGTTEIGAAKPYPYHDLGYGSGVISFYIASGGVWDEAYIFRVQQSPAYYSTPQYWDFVVGPSNYSPASDQSAAMRADIIGIATPLSTEYGVALLTTNEGMTTLSTYGEIYFQNAVSGLATMCPTLFSVQVRSPSYTRRSWDFTLANALKTKYSGTFIGDFMTGFAGLTSSNTQTAMNFLSIMLFVALMFVSLKWFKANVYAAFLDGYTLILLLMLNGFFFMTLAGFIAFMSVTVGGVILFLNRS